MSTTIATTTDTTPGFEDLPRLLQLPLELRQQIYSNLCPDTPLSYPIPTLNITSVSHHPPPTSLLRANRALHQDLTAYFYTHATWKFIVSHAFNFYRIDPTLSNLASSRLLKRIQRIELVLFFDGSLLKDYPSFGTRNFCEEIRRRATRACEVLATAPKLQVVTVSWIDTTTSGDLKEKKKVLEPLRLLEGKCRFEIGELVWPAAPEPQAFIKAVRTAIDSAPSVAAF